MMDAAALYTRQQLGEIAGLDDTTLNYWSREGLLVPTEGGTGRGSHRRFDFVQVNIAAMLGATRRFRPSINVLRSFADLMQSAARLGAARELHPYNYGRAADIADRLDEFRRGEPVMLSVHRDEPQPKGLYGTKLVEWLSEKRPAESEEELLATFEPNTDWDPFETIVAVAERIGPNQGTIAHIYADLVYDVLRPGFSDAFSWLIGFGPDDNLLIEFGFEGAKFFDRVADAPTAAEDFGPGIFIPVSGIIRRMWGPRGYDSAIRAYHLEREAAKRAREPEQIRNILAEYGIEATATPTTDPDDGGYRLNLANDADWPKARRVLSTRGFEFSTDDGPGDKSP